MADLAHLSDAELDAAIKAQAPSDLSHMSDSDLDAAIKASTPQQGMLEQAGRWAVNQLPTAGAIVGGIAGTPLDVISGPAGNIAGAAGGSMVGQAAKDWINSKIDPDNAPQSAAEGIKNLPGAAINGALMETGGQIAGRALGAVAKSAYVKPWLDEAGQLVLNGFNKAGQYVGAAAEKQAIKATGATGLQASKFAPGTGRMLLDDGIVKFGRSQEGVADAAAKALEEQGDKIGSLTKDLSAKNSENVQGLLEERSNLMQKIARDKAAAARPAEDALMFPDSKYAVTRGNTTELFDQVPKKFTQKLKHSVDSIESVPAMSEPAPGTPTWAEPETPRLPSGASEMTPDQVRLSAIDQQMSAMPGSKSQLLQGIDSKLNSLGNDPAQAQVVNQLKSLRENIASGPDLPSLNQIEGTKQGFQQMVNWANPEGNAAKAAAADVYKNAGEAVAAQTDYQAAKQFIGAKAKYGQLAPVAEASAKRAATAGQSPMGGFLDVTSAAAGGIAGGPAGVVAAPVIRRTVSPYLASSLASTANGLSQVLAKTPQALGKWAAPLAAAAARGEMSLNASSYVLQQRDPEFRKKMEELNNGPLTDTNE